MPKFFWAGTCPIATMVLVIGLLACQPESQTFPADPNQIKVFSTGFRLFSAPCTAGRAIGTLQLGEMLQDLNQVSPFLTPLYLQGKSYLEPWLQVRTQSGAVGWVYGAVLYNQSGKPAPQLLSKRMAALFGKSLAKKIIQYAQSFKTVQTDQEMAVVYHNFRVLIDSLSLHTSFALAIDPTFSLPDLFWLPGVLPGIVPQINPQRDDYSFFAHFGVFKKKAKTTQGKADDAFFDWCIQQFPQDSIEYSYPRYCIETEPGKTHSLLGRGLHFQTLQQLDALYRQKTPFESDLILFKNRCIDDITASNASFYDILKTYGADKLSSVPENKRAALLAALQAE